MMCPDTRTVLRAAVIGVLEIAVSACGTVADIGAGIGQATLLDNYSEYENEQANEYISRLGNVLAFFSERPSVYAGYSFQILDNDVLNAFATPGGVISSSPAA